MNNLFDKDPPLVSSGASDSSVLSSCQGTYCNGNTYPGTYTALGRSLFGGLTFDF